MGSVIAVFRILPDSQEHAESVKAELEALKPERLEEEPLAFGLRAFKFTAVIPDSGGVMDELENKLRVVKNVNSVETLSVSRSL